MAQFARPDSDISNAGAWGANPSDGILFDKLDESVADDTTTTIGSPNPPATSPGSSCELGLSAVPDPRASSGHTLRVRWRKPQAGVRIDLQLELLQGGASLSTPVLITVTDIADTTWTDSSLVLSSAQCDAITDYADLSVRLTATRVGAGTNRLAQVTFLELEVPNVQLSGSTSLTVSGAGTITGRGVLTGAGNVTFAPAGGLTGRGVLAGAGSVVFGQSATITGRGVVTGSGIITFGAAGGVGGGGTSAISGSASIAFVGSASPTGRVALAGAVVVTFGCAGSITGRGILAGGASLTLTGPGDLRGIGRIAGSAGVTWLGTGSLRDANAPLVTGMLHLADARFTSPALRAISVTGPALRDVRFTAPALTSIVID